MVSMTFSVISENSFKHVSLEANLSEVAAVKQHLSRIYKTARIELLNTTPSISGSVIKKPEFKVLIVSD